MSQIVINRATFAASGKAALTVQTPFHPSFAPAARELGGKWQPDKTYWVFDQRDEDRVRALCLRLFGTDGDTTPDLCTITVRLTDEAGKELVSFGGELWLAGRQVANRRGRDIRVQLGNGVIVVSGGFPASGGSRNNPDLSPRPGTVLEVRDVPVPLALAAVERYKESVSIGAAEGVTR